MNKEEKELLRKDLCARLPYQVMTHKKWSYRDTDKSLHYNEGDEILGINDIYAVEQCKPYLRPLSSMIDEERKELLHLGAITRLENEEVIDVSCVGFDYHALVQDWLNSHHFDYRDLISKGLALEAPKGMYDIK